MRGPLINGLLERLMSDTLFMKIIQREIPADIVYEDDQCLCFKDVNPQAPIHLLLVPKKPIRKLVDADEGDQALLGYLMLKAADIARENGMKITSVNLRKPSLEDVYLHYTGRSMKEVDALEEEKIVTAGSSHPPYAEKNCQGCHDFKNKNLLLAPPDELCEMCHVGFVDSKGKNIHGPVAVRDCLACHLPHASNYKSLLKESVSGICSTCHQEKRLAFNMHDTVMEHKMECVNCHDAHGGDVTYFLK